MIWSGAINQMANSTLSGIIKGKYGSTATGVSVHVRVYDKDSRDTLLGSTTSDSADGTWSTTVSGKDVGTTVLAVFSYEGTWAGQTDPAGAEFLTTE